MAITPPGGMPLASGCVLVLALIDAVYGTCTPATITVNGQRLLIGSTNPASTNAVAEGTSHCPSVCRDNECATLGGVYLKGAYMCCSGAFKLMCDGNNDCGATLTNGQWSAVPAGTCAATGNTVAPCGLDEERCGGLRSAMKTGAFPGLSVAAGGAKTDNGLKSTATVGESTMLSIGGQLMSDFTQEMCHDEPTYESGHTITFSDFVYTPADAAKLTAVDATFVPTTPPANCAFPCRRGAACTSMQTTAGGRACGTLAVDTELVPAVMYKPPLNFFGSVSFNYRVRTNGATQAADTGVLAVSVTYVQPACVETPATYCGGFGKCTVQGCLCIKGYTGDKCASKVTSPARAEESSGSILGFVLLIVLVLGIGGFVYYANKSEMFVMDDEKAATQPVALAAP